MKSFFRAVLVTVVLSFAGSPLQARSIDELMGLAIQNYLEGDMSDAVENLNKILEEDSGHTRARDLMERSLTRLAERADTEEEAKEVMVYIQKALEHMSDSDIVQENKQKIESIIGEDIETEPPSEPEKTKAMDPAEEERYRRRISELTSRIRELEERIENNSDVNYDLLDEVDRLRKERGDIIESIYATRADLSDAGLSGRNIILILFFVILSGAGSSFFLFMMYKRGSAKLLKNLADEKRQIMNLRSSYAENAEKLSKKLSEYGKSYQRADELEKNWEKIFRIVERLSRGGSTKKFVLQDSPDGRKAVTGIDTRSRARADSVEVISEIFSGSERAPELLKPFLNDSDNRTRANAAVAYHKYDSEKAMAVLGDMAESKDKWMRLSAAWALGEIGGASTSTALEKLLDDPDKQVKNRARISLEKIMGRETDSDSEK